jgi:hypothetical protein
VRAAGPPAALEKLTFVLRRLAESYAHLIGVNDTFPDWDMLPLGTMMHAEKSKGVYGPASATRLTRDEQARARAVLRRRRCILHGCHALVEADIQAARTMTRACR